MLEPKRQVCRRENVQCPQPFLLLRMGVLRIAGGNFLIMAMHNAGGLGAVFRTVLETMRTLFVWLVDLLLFYTPLGLGKLGESWSSYSLIQAAGCAPLPAATYLEVCCTLSSTHSAICRPLGCA